MNWNSPTILIIFVAHLWVFGRTDSTESSHNLTGVYRFKRQSCSGLKHKCSNGECIESYSLCDGARDCSDGSDETAEICGATRCPALAFVCDYGACVEREARCNGKTECSDGSDEKGCKDSSSNNSNNSCGPGDYKCSNGQCIDQYSKCDGTLDCTDGSDETKVLCKNIRCPTSAFRCAYGACVEQTAKCNGRLDCPDGSDEAGCPSDPGHTPSGTPSVTAPVAGGCRLPEHPRHGVYISTQCRPGDSAPACRNTPGASVPTNWLLKYACDKGYDLTSTDVDYSVCEAGVWKNPLDCIKLCQPLQSLSVDIRCMYGGQEIPCDKPMKPKTIAFVKCKEHYHHSFTPEYSSLRCNDGGEWSYRLYYCTPDCGVSIESGTFIPLILNGLPTKQGEFPWLAALYLKNNANGKWEQKCAGTLITSHIVLTAAHCLVNPITGQIQPEDIKVGLGKYYRNFYTHENYSIIADVREIVVPRFYSGAATNYAVDIGLIDLATSIQVTSFIMPACVEWGTSIGVRPGEIGHVAGWGTTENQTSSETVLSANLEYVDAPSCILKLRPVYQKLVTHDKFCAGSINGSQVDRGDSGGGLTFVKNGQHFVFGVVSTKIVQEKSFTLFTDVANTEHHSWLEEQRSHLNERHSE